MDEVILQQLTYREIDELVDSETVVVVPVGSIEQHGMHLPLEVDTRIVEEIARQAARKASEKVAVLVTPSLWLGCSNHHMNFPGTLSLNQDTFIKVVTELAASLIHHGFKKILFLNGHGGNTNPLKVAVNQIRDGTKGDVLAAMLDYWQLIKEEVADLRESEPGGISHAGEFETSCMLYLDDKLVRKDKFSKFMPKWGTPYFGLGWYLPQSVHLGFHIKDFSTAGVIGDPTVATKEKGQRFIEIAAEKVNEFLIDFSRWEFSTLYKVENPKTEGGL